MEDLKVLKLALLNDEFRKKGSGVVFTRGANCVRDIEGLMNKVRSFNRFDEDNDPWGEHDFGKIDWNGENVFWKIDYFNQSFEEWEDPTSPKCNRLLTVMLADEY